MRRPTYIAVMSLPRFKIRSGSFRKGFRAGFSAPYSFFCEAVFPRTTQFDASAWSAWSKVGEALRDAEKIERGNIGQNTRKLFQKEHVITDRC